MNIENKEDLLSPRKVRNVTLVHTILLCTIVVLLGISVYFLAFKNKQDQESLEKTDSSKLTVLTATEPDQKEVVIGSQKYDDLKKDESNRDLNTNSSSSSITSADIEKYMTGIGRIDCTSDASSQDYSNVSTGSASLWNFENIGYTVLTNSHVIDSIVPSDNSYCSLNISDYGNIKADSEVAKLHPDYPNTGFWWLKLNNLFRWNDVTDVAVIPIGVNFIYGDQPTGLNYAINTLPLCSTVMPLNSPLVAVGFPSSTMVVTDDGISSFRTITNGIISAYEETTKTQDGLPYPNYFTSAKIDTGNSGGIAFSKENGNLCVLGIPTWVSTMGTYDTQGIIQNIHNVMYRN